MANSVRVIKSGGVWIVRRDGNTKSSGNFATQKEAYLKAREIALNNGLTITVYYPTGGIHKVITPKEKPSDDGCFITTACVKYYNLNDNCYELQTLRKFRDNYLSHTDENKLLIRQYYKIAPEIVKALNSDSNKNEQYGIVFREIIIACNLVENKMYEEAKQLYVKIVSYLINLYCISK